MQLEHVPSDFDLRSIARIVWHRKLSIVIAIVVFVGGQLFLSSRETPVYTANTTILVTPQVNLFAIGAATDDATIALANEALTITSVDIKDQIAKMSGKRIDVTAKASNSSDTVKISASGSNPQQVRDDVNEYTSDYATIRKNLVNNGNDQSAAKIQSQITTIENKLTQLTTNESALKAKIANAVNDPTLQASLSAAYIDLQAKDSTAQTFLQNQLGQLESQQSLQSILGVVGGGNTSQSNITILSYASVPGSPVSPKPLRDALVAAMAGLLVGITIAYAREQTEDHVRGRLDLEADFPNYPVLAAVPSFTGIDPNEIITERKRTSPAAEGYRKLRTSLEFLSLTQRLGVVELTSPAAGEGKTTTAVNLAVAVAQSGQRVIIVCADFRIPKTHLYFDLKNDVGMTSVLLDRSTLADAVKPTRIPGLYILPSGPIPPNPSELLDSERAHEVIDALSARFDLVIIDTPPILPVADPLVTATMADATIVVVRSRKSRRRQLRRAMETLTQLEIPLAGLVLNDETADEAHAFGYGYGYYGKSYGHREVSQAIQKAEAGKANGNGNGTANGAYSTLSSSPPSSRRTSTHSADLDLGVELGRPPSTNGGGLPFPEAADPAPGPDGGTGA